MCLLTLTFTITPSDTNEHCTIEDVVVDNTSTGIELNGALDRFLIEVAMLPDETEIAVSGIDVSFHATTDTAITTVNKTLETIPAELSKLSLC